MRQTLLLIRWNLKVYIKRMPKRAPTKRRRSQHEGAPTEYRYHPLCRYRRNWHERNRGNPAHPSIFGAGLRHCGWRECHASSRPRYQYFNGHRADNLGDAEIVVISSAIKQDNPEVLARSRQFPLYRAQKCYRQSCDLNGGIAVAGTHKPLLHLSWRRFWMPLG